MSATRTLLLLIAPVLSVAGCTATEVTRRIPSAPAFGHDATLLYVPGIGGLGTSDAECARGIRSGGYDGKIQTYNWSANRGLLAALWDHAGQRAVARRIAEQICEVRKTLPASPIVLVAHSAGAGIVVQALEDLPAGQQLDGIVLLAPALSREHDLTPALRHVRGRADVFCSDRDTMALAIGTSLFGNVDGVPGEAAGHAGFIRPASASTAEYLKLHTHGVSPERRFLGDDGGHNGSLRFGVAAVIIAPLLAGSSTTPPPVRDHAIENAVTWLRLEE